MLLFVYCLLIAAASMAGGWLPGMIRFTHARLHALLSLVAGFMLGAAFFHMLPHSVHSTGSLDASLRSLMLGLLVMFFLVRALHFHQHGSVEADEPGPDCDHEHDADHAHHHDQQHVLSWTGVFAGLVIHTLIDGVALAAAVEAARLGDLQAGGLAGVATFLAIILHKPLDAMSITTLMNAGGWPRRTRNRVNAVFAVICPIGALLFLAIGRQLGDSSPVIGYALAFSAGVFICIALGDLLPEIQFHSHDRFKLSACLVTGVLVALAIGLLEPRHRHDQADADRGNASSESRSPESD